MGLKWTGPVRTGSHGDRRRLHKINKVPSGSSSWRLMEGEGRTDELHLDSVRSNTAPDQSGTGPGRVLPSLWIRRLVWKSSPVWSSAPRRSGWSCDRADVCCETRTVLAEPPVRLWVRLRTWCRAAWRGCRGDRWCCGESRAPAASARRPPSERRRRAGPGRRGAAPPSWTWTWSQRSPEEEEKRRWIGEEGEEERRRWDWGTGPDGSNNVFLVGSGSGFWVQMKSWRAQFKTGLLFPEPLGRIRLVFGSLQPKQL